MIKKLIKIFNLLKQKFKASDVVELYRKKTSLFFLEKNNYLFWFLLSKYTDTGRINLFKENFGKRKISESLTDLIITAVKDQDLETTFTFNKREALISSNKDFTYFDALMATSAAPTFFHPHKIENKGYFYDGGVQVNNPSMIVYSEFNNFYKENYENLFILNLGSGYCISESLNAYSQNQGSLFWAKNLINVTIPNQEMKVNQFMYSKLEDNYQSWQISLPYNKEFKFDACNDEDFDSMEFLAYEYIEMLKISESNYFNKLIDFLQNNESSFTL